MRTIREIAQALGEQRRRRRAKLPWRELEAEAARQGCSPADIFFDRAGHTVGLPEVPKLTSAHDRDVSRNGRARKGAPSRPSAGALEREQG